jgi:hypothetical protein
VAAGTITLNGLITANGVDANSAWSANWQWSGAGAGGGIYISCGNLVGSGTIRANGGNGGYYSNNGTGGGGGGGGRIALFVRSAPHYTGGGVLNCAVANFGVKGVGARAPASDGSPGTVYHGISPRGTMFSSW